MTSGMHKNIIDNWVGFVFGVFDGGTTLMQVSWHDEFLKLLIGALTALIAGGMGVVGKYLVVWGWKKIKSFTIKK